MAPLMAAGGPLTRAPQALLSNSSLTNSTVRSRRRDRSGPLGARPRRCRPVDSAFACLHNEARWPSSQSWQSRLDSASTRDRCFFPPRAEVRRTHLGSINSSNHASSSLWRSTPAIADTKHCAHKGFAALGTYDLLWMPVRNTSSREGNSAGIGRPDEGCAAGRCRSGLQRGQTVPNLDDSSLLQTMQIVRRCSSNAS